MLKKRTKDDIIPLFLIALLLILFSYFFCKELFYRYSVFFMAINHFIGTIFLVLIIFILIAFIIMIVRRTCKIFEIKK